MYQKVEALCDVSINSSFLIVEVLGERSLCTVKYSTFASDEHCCIKAHGHQICGHPFHWSIERSRSLRYRAGLGRTLQRTAVLRAVRVPLQGLGSLFLSLLGRELFVHRRQSI